MQKRERRQRHRLRHRPKTTTQLDAGALYRRGPLQFSLSVFASAIDDYILVQAVRQDRHPPAACPAAGDGRHGQCRRPRVHHHHPQRRRHHLGRRGRRSAGASPNTGSRRHARLRARRETTPTPVPSPSCRRSKRASASPTPRAAWSAGALLRAAAEQDRIAVNQGNIVGQDLGPTAGFTVLSLNGGWRPRSGVLLTAGVDNLFDRAYAEHLSRGGAMVSGYVQTTQATNPGTLSVVQAPYVAYPAFQNTSRARREAKAPEKARHTRGRRPGRARIPASRRRRPVLTTRLVPWG